MGDWLRLVIKRIKGVHQATTFFHNGVEILFSTNIVISQIELREFPISVV